MARFARLYWTRPQLHMGVWLATISEIRKSCHNSDHNGHMRKDDEPTVFTRLRDALSDAQQEEADFAAEVTADDPTSLALYNAFLQWADEVFGSAKSLRSTLRGETLLRHDIGLAVDVGMTVRDVAELPFVKPLVQLRLARFGVDRIETGAERMYKVFDCLIDAELQPRAQSYLSSVAQLYIMGFNSEAVVMARSALEAALESALAERSTHQSIPERTLYESIVAAGPRGVAILDEVGVSEAHAIRLAGKDAVHFQLGAQKLKALDAIRALQRILRQIFPPSKERQ